MKYSALVLSVTLAVFWTSTEARNSYLNDVVAAMTRYYTEEMRDLPEPYKSRITEKLSEAKNSQWETLDEYVLHVQRIMEFFMHELLRTKRHANYYDGTNGNGFVTIQKIKTALTDSHGPLHWDR